MPVQPMKSSPSLPPRPSPSPKSPPQASLSPPSSSSSAPLASLLPPPPHRPRRSTLPRPLLRLLRRQIHRYNQNLATSKSGPPHPWLALNGLAIALVVFLILTTRASDHPPPSPPQENQNRA
ncbi:neural Wiskott-Aldrich syndrome protein-like [Cajanus cajan]|uniref:neural Wiskott-Aldrich syndrome protein-like n=1 Tax=Cajanus cajan TaxID=3821 RepID=UPI00098D8D9C|nr:neural Wiskott-Aldrich syndrome protein-like [Cajanus cajan]